MTVLVVALAGWLVLNVLVLLGAYVRASAAPPQSAGSRAPVTVPAPRTSSADVSTPATATSD
jgi:hypothetical protein